MEGTPPEERDVRGQETTPGGWLPPVPPGGAQPVGAPPGQAGAHPPPQHGAYPPPQGPYPPPPAPGWQQPQAGYGQTPPPTPPPPGWQHPPWQQPGWQQPPWQPAGPGNGTAVTGFVLSVSGVALLFFSAGLSSVISLGLAIAGTIVGRNGRQKVDRGETTQHRGLAQAGFIVGIVGIALSLIAIVTWVLIFALVDDLDDDSDFFDEDFQSARIAGALAGTAVRLLT